MAQAAEATPCEGDAMLELAENSPEVCCLGAGIAHADDVGSTGVNTASDLLVWGSVKNGGGDHCGVAGSGMTTAVFNVVSCVRSACSPITERDKGIDISGGAAGSLSGISDNG